MKQDVSREKLSEKKLLLLSPTLMGRLKRCAGVAGVDESEIIRRGLSAELDRMESQASVEAVRLEKLKALAAAQGGDIDTVLDQMLRQVKEPELPLPVGSAA